MKWDKLLIALTISAGVLSLLLYRAVVNAPLPKDVHRREKAESLQKKAPQGMDVPRGPTVESAPVVDPQGKEERYIQEKAPFEPKNTLSAEETKRMFEADMKPNIPPGQSIEEAFKNSMKTDRMEEMSEQEKEEIFLRSMGGQMSDEERRAYFEESMGINAEE